MFLNVSYKKYSYMLIVLFSFLFFSKKFFLTLISFPALIIHGHVIGVLLGLVSFLFTLSPGCSALTFSVMTLALTSMGSFSFSILVLRKVSSIAWRSVKRLFLLLFLMSTSLLAFVLISSSEFLKNKMKIYNLI